MKLDASIKHITDIKHLAHLSEEEKVQLAEVTKKFPFRTNEYYLSLIDPDDPDDPIRRIIIPDIRELDQWGRLDPSDEESYTIIPGLEHKYTSTVLLLVSDTCEGFCRYCFRKRVFMQSRQKQALNLTAAVNYITNHEEITNVLLTGGDPLVLSTDRIEEILQRLRRIEHVRIIRIGTRMPVFNPGRIIHDQRLFNVLEKYNRPDSKIYIMTHFDHPRELTDNAIEAVNLLRQTGAVICNQMPLVKGINDNPDVLAQLFAELSFIGAAPYYVFQCRPALGNRHFIVPLEEAYEIFEAAKAMVSGLAKRARFVMSHSYGKIEVVAKTENHVYLKCHRAARDEDSGRFMIFKSNPNAYWFDDYDEVTADYPINEPYRSHGPQ